MAGRHGGSTDVLRFFNRALDLLSSTSPDSDRELLELVKKAKKDQNKEALHPNKKARTGRGANDAVEMLSPAFRPSLVSQPEVNIGSAGMTSSSNQPSQITSSSGSAMQPRANPIRAGAGRARIEKPKHKSTR